MFGHKYVEQTSVSIEYLNGVANQVLTLFKNENIYHEKLLHIIYIH